MNFCSTKSVTYPGNRPCRRTRCSKYEAVVFDSGFRRMFPVVVHVLISFDLLAVEQLGLRVQVQL